MLWTYWELAEDFGPSPDAVRRRLWAGLLAELAWKGRVGFWPLSEVEEGGLAPRPELFWRGVREFGVSTVVCFGQAAFGVLLPGQPFGFRRCRLGSITLVTLPGPAELLAEPEAQAFAKQTLARLNPECAP